MNIYKGLLFLDGFRISPEDADDLKAPARATTPARAASRRAVPAGPRWRRALRGVAAFAGLLPAHGGTGGCG